MTVQDVKQRFSIIGNAPSLDRAIQKAMQVAPTDISVLVSGESGVGKESIPKIIHQLSHRKHKPYIAVNCGAIPEGTIDSELFGHEKGAFTGATGARKGYFEEANGGTIFLDEVGELPLATQVRLLRVLETGEFIRVGSSRTQKTDVRVVGATNVNLLDAIQEAKFREDLYYRLNTVEINLPPLRDREDDIYLLFRKFARDFAEKYRLPSIHLKPEAVGLLSQYRWPGNIRQLRNLVEQISVVETDREIDAATLHSYIPDIDATQLPMLYNKGKSAADNGDFSTEREILYKVLFDMRKDLNNLRELVNEMASVGNFKQVADANPSLIKRILSSEENTPAETPGELIRVTQPQESLYNYEHEDNVPTIEVENLSLQDKEIEMIKKSLERNNNKRKAAAKELGISERTLYRKIKQYNL
jgi:transcriptional regulator with PAS, ATPase and Fis domain